MKKIFMFFTMFIMVFCVFLVGSKVNAQEEIIDNDETIVAMEQGSSTYEAATVVIELLFDDLHCYARITNRSITYINNVRIKIYGTPSLLIDYQLYASNSTSSKLYYGDILDVREGLPNISAYYYAIATYHIANSVETYTVKTDVVYN
ncbi:MAG: hypothetical protein ACI35S_08865 [Anaeroplasma sp.]